VSDMSGGPGWWQNSDGLWYPPELDEGHHVSNGHGGPPVVVIPKQRVATTALAERIPPSVDVLTVPGKQLPSKEKVRGMNASLALSGGGLRERARRPVRAKPMHVRPMHISRRQVLMAVCLLAAAVAGAFLTLRSVASGLETFPGIVSSANVYNLDFPNTGTVTAIMVKPGQHVHAGQVLAQQDAATLQATVNADQAVVAADQAAVNQAQVPQLTGAQQNQAAQQLQQAKTALQNAQSALSAARSVGASEIAAAQAVVSSDQGLVTADQSRFSQACPNGVPPPSSNPGAQQAYLTCQADQQQLEKDQSQLAVAQAQVPAVSAQAQQSITTQNASVASAQATLNLVESQLAAQSSPSAQATLAQDQANLQTAQSNLAQAQSQLAQASIVAPSAGVIAEVSGSPGQVLGPSGVRQYAGPAALPTPSGFQLFPSQPSASSGQTATDFTPLIQLAAGRTEVVAQVPEASVSKFHVGRAATITINALGWTTSAKVGQVVLDPARSTSVTYDVVFVPNRTIPGLLPGMSASVS
jgi:multidrug efflux pump subunit AcrA (membrane-fusion protein)